VYVVDRAGEPPLDVTDRTGLETLAAEIGTQDGRLDMLINAAGILTENRPVDEITAEELLRNYEVNVLGTLTCCQVFGPLLRERRGAVVNVSSQAALVSLPSQGGLYSEQRCCCRAHPLACDQLG
jgi:meso-butanediol dehydrogenase / (S,S)-butanediol dehydrogenase / diacetyl reductase